MRTSSTWGHAPNHRFEEAGAYVVTGGTYHRAHLLSTRAHLTEVMTLLLSLAEKHDWELQAWAIFSNHYHFIANSPGDPTGLPDLIREFHSKSAILVNRLDCAKGRKVWWQYWDSFCPNDASRLARMNYVWHNPVKHRIVKDAEQYPWCSAFRSGEELRRVKRILDTFWSDGVSVHDEYEPLVIL